MNRSFSIYLDIVRFGAACLVYLWHSNMRLLVSDVLPLSNYGHSSVIVFFVLSGFVIAYVTETKERHWSDYAASRLSRVFSVVIPALVLTPLLDALGRHLYPAMYDYPFDRFALRLAGCVLMLNEAWLVSITYFSNVPYWSIAFEFWYYVLFGLMMFLRGPVRLVGGALLLALIGPKLLLLLPVWWSGVWLYRWRWIQQRSPAFSWCLVLLGTGGILLTHALGVYSLWSEHTERWLGTSLYQQLTFARFFLGDYLLCALVFCQFAGVRNVADQLAPLLVPLERPVRFVAGYTFTLYLLHQPLFLFWTSVVRGDPHGIGFWWVVTVLTGLSVLVVGYFTEQQRHGFRSWILRRLSAISTRQ
ncbi:MAG: acyltransferase family protein [Rhizobacter sp.]